MAARAATPVFSSHHQHRRSPLFNAFFSSVDLFEMTLIETLAYISTDLLSSSSYSSSSIPFQRKNTRSLATKVRSFLSPFHFLTSSFPKPRLQLATTCNRPTMPYNQPFKNTHYEYTYIPRIGGAGQIVPAGRGGGGGAAADAGGGGAGGGAQTAQPMAYPPSTYYVPYNYPAERGVLCLFLPSYPHH